MLSLSLGSTIGAHDPQSSMCQFLDEIGKEAIVCLSAGNEGDAKAALHKTLTDDDKMIKTFLHPFAYKYVEGGTSVQTQNTVRYGQLCVYADDDQEFNVRVGLYRRSRNFRSMSYEMPAVGTDTYTFYCTEDGYAQNSTDVVAPANSVYALNFDGFVAIARGIDPSCGRYCCNISMDLLDKEANNLSDEFVVGIEVTGTPGTATTSGATPRASVSTTTTQPALTTARATAPFPTWPWATTCSPWARTTPARSGSRSTATAPTTRATVSVPAM